MPAGGQLGGAEVLGDPETNALLFAVAKALQVFAGVCIRLLAAMLRAREFFFGFASGWLVLHYGHPLSVHAPIRLAPSKSPRAVGSDVDVLPFSSIFG